ncbi:MAG: AAA family ATPase [Myxococcota bacterium]
MVVDRLVQVRIRGYRAVIDAAFDPAIDRTVVVGGNGSGKSSVLDAIGLVGDLVRHGPGAFRGHLRGNLYDPTDRFDVNRSAFGAGQIEVELGFRLGQNDFGYQVAIGPVDDGWRIVGEMLVGPTHPLIHRDRTGVRVRRVDATDAIPLVPVYVDPQLPAVTLGADPISHPDLAAPLRFLRGLCVVQPTPVAMRAAAAPFDRPARESPLDPLPHRYGEDATTRLIRLANDRPGQRASFLRLMGEFVGWTEFRTPRASRVEFYEGTPDPLAFEAASDGTVVEAWLLALALDPPTQLSVLLLDEPSAQFFRKSLQRPAELLKTLATQRQLIVATHAAPLVSELADSTRVWVATRSPGAGTLLRRLSAIHGSDEAVIELGLGEGALLEAREMPEDGT